MSAPLDPGSRTVAVLEPVPVLARGLHSLVREWDRECTVRVLSEVEGYWSVPFDLVVCGPSSLSAYVETLELPQVAAAPTIGVILDSATTDFQVLLRSAVDVLWDYRGSVGSFGVAAEAALRAEPWVSESLTQALAVDIGLRLRQSQDAADFHLTSREVEILRLMAAGLSNREIGVRLFISANTVKNHVRSVLDKLQAASRTEAVVIGARVGLVDIRARY